MTAFRIFFLRIATGLGVLSLLMSLSIACQPVGISLNRATQEKATPMPIPTKEDWVIVNSLKNKTQITQGAEVYRLVCSPCHAYDGTGLTDQWRATWGENDQNCWQSKCHASNHPPEGFVLPMSPPIVGPSIPQHFRTANDLYNFIHAAMPWYAPNTLTEEKAWAATAYVMRLNGMNPPDQLGASNASQITIFSTKTIDPALKLSIPPGSQK